MPARASQKPARTGPPGWRFQAVVAGLGILVSSYDLGAISVAFDPLRHRWHLSTPVLSTLGTLTLLGMLVGSLVTGVLADRYGRRRLVVADVVLFVLAATAAALAPDFGVLAAARLATGLASGADFAVVFPFVAETAPAQARGRTMAWIMLTANFGTLAAYGAGALFLHLDPAEGWRVVLGLGALLALPVVLLRGQLVESPTWDVLRLPSVRQILAETRRGLRHDGLLASTAATFSYQVGDQGLGLVLPLLLAGVLGTTAASGALAATAVKAVTIPAALLTVLGIERLGRRHLQVAGFVLRALCLGGLGVWLLEAGPHVPAVAVGALLAAAYFVGAAGPDKVTVIGPAEAFDTTVRSTSQGLSQAGGRLGGILGVTGYGLLAALGGPGAGLLLFAVAAAFGGLVSRWAPLAEGTAGPDERTPAPTPVPSAHRASWSRGRPR
ncbi:MFS transporter [Aciditerrimonas ferrireducens]|uniref:MFS transporter n=1 Tax=Aciditerrimonas ferrireducens TaxID=667306 RepID=A0ABV6C074_9ACTN